MKTFETKEAARDFLKTACGLCEGNGVFFPRPYMLSHGEWSSPNYYIRKYKDGYGIHKEVNFYSGTFGAPKSGRIDPCEMTQ